jgi:hypothetical protein
MKRCPKCNKGLPISLFAMCTGRPRGGSYCKACQKEYCKAHYKRVLQGALQAA